MNTQKEKEMNRAEYVGQCREFVNQYQNQLLVCYVRKGYNLYNGKKCRGNPVGVTVAFKRDDQIYVGYSLCHIKPKNPTKKASYDTWNKHIGLRNAIARAEPIHKIEEAIRLSKAQPDDKTIPHSVHFALERAIERANRYFKVNST